MINQFELPKPKHVFAKSTTTLATIKSSQLDATDLSEADLTLETDMGLETDDDTDEGTTQDFSRSVSLEPGQSMEMSID